MKLFLLSLLFSSLFAGSEVENGELLSRTRALMGTYVTITLPQKNNTAISASFDLIQKIEDSLSTYDPKATLSKLNQTHTVPYDTYLAEAITLSKNYYKETNGYFDITIGSISKKLYHFGEEKTYSPSEKALKKGYQWRDEISRDFRPATIKEIPNDIKDVDDTICREILACENCQKNYQIQKGELRFYRKMKLPIPHYCPDCRHTKRTKLREPCTLFKRNCVKCKKEIYTTFAPDRLEKVLCEKCYLQQVN